MDASAKPPTAGESAAGRSAAGKQRSPLSRLLTVLIVLALITGIGLIAYPIVSDLWNRTQQTKAVGAYVAKTKDISISRRKAMLKAARAYNKRLALAGEGRYKMTKAERHEYENLLDVTGTGIMGYLSIPKLGVELPIYHGTDESVLQIAIGHLPGTSLPVGGPGTHAAVSGHTGLPSAMLLTGLDRMKKGDTFSYTVLGITETYQVDRISVVKPTDLSKLAIVDGKDLGTIITCTPYGVNNHRLLVRGHRIPTPNKGSHGQDMPINKFVIGEWSLLGLILAMIIISLSIGIRCKKRRTIGSK